MVVAELAFLCNLTMYSYFTLQSRSCMSFVISKLNKVRYCAFFFHTAKVSIFDVDLSMLYCDR